MDVATCQPMTKAARHDRKRAPGSRVKASGCQRNGKELQEMEVPTPQVESDESSSETGSSKEPTPEPIQGDADRHLQVDVASARQTDINESLSNEGPKRRRSLSPPPSRKTRRKTLVDSVGTQPVQQTYNAEASTSASSSQFQFVQESGVSKAPSTARSAKRSVFGKGSNKPTDTFFCNVCKEAGYFASFPRSDNLKRHLLAHKSEENECWCPYCEKGIGLAYNAFEHFNLVHLDHCTHFKHEPARRRKKHCPMCGEDWKRTICPHCQDSWTVKIEGKWKRKVPSRTEFSRHLMDMDSGCYGSLKARFAALGI
ncbi:hypothetical protein FRC15_005023 [Serendipita sp. 397]|nr:hypothetical protein FRC15_005023 [Serendipita sp. 397]